MDWVVSIGSALVLWMYGNKLRSAPICGILMQIVWATWGYMDDLYAFYPLAVIFSAVHWRNYKKWSKV